MSYRPLLSVLVLWPLLQIGTASAENTCKTNYQVVQPACRESEEILSFTTVIDRHVLVNKGACKIPSAIALCQEFIPRYQQAHPKAQRIEVSSPATEETLEICNVSLQKIKQKKNVYCDFTYQEPQFRKVADANCPVEQISEANGCFGPNAPALDPTSITECLGMKVNTTADLWIKGVCLHDISQASLNLDISAADYQAVQTKLAIVKQKIQGDPQFAKLSQILESK